MVRAIREVEESLGSPVKKMIPEEEEMARLGMKRIRSEWSWQRIAERYDVIYRDVLDDDIEVRRKAALNVA